jgi:2-polyprenyl-3-methyl-5-hydroxy-6-metoxy-1,4-benzoquinol methylase
MANGAVTPSPDVEAALAEARAMTKSEHDAAYWAFHEPRFRRTVQRVTEIAPRGIPILDVGSHYLHLSAVLRLLGYEVWALDLPYFQELPFVRERANSFGIHAISADIQTGRFIPGDDGRFGLVLFCEILEHITFNPCEFWRSIYRLLRVGGQVYITTPNSLAAMNIVSTLKRMVLLEGIGLDIASIFDKHTTGHHWKEYSRREVIEYFQRLSPDFSVEVSAYHYRSYSYSPRSLKDWGRKLVRWIGNSSAALADELDIVVTLTGKTSFTASTPVFG